MHIPSIQLQHPAASPVVPLAVRPLLGLRLRRPAPPLERQPPPPAGAAHLDAAQVPLHPGAPDRGRRGGVLGAPLQAAPGGVQGIHGARPRLRAHSGGQFMVDISRWKS